MASAGVPPRFFRARSDRAAELADHVRRGGNVLLFGPVGTGKTTLACAMVAELIARGGSRPRFTTFHEVLDALKRGFDDHTDAMPRYAGCSCLVLDDLGKERPTPFALEQLFALVDSRSSQLLPTVVTSQYGPSELAARLAGQGDMGTAQAIVSRLAEGARQVHLTGSDRRIGPRAAVAEGQSELVSSEEAAKELAELSRRLATRHSITPEEWVRYRDLRFRSGLDG